MSQSKKPFALRLSADMMAALEKWAQEEFRSTNGQIEYLLHAALRKENRLPGKESPRNSDKKGGKD
jgi:hypothetical protein